MGGVNEALRPEPRAPLDVLAFNSGSSSLKYGLFRVGPAHTEALHAGAAESVEQVSAQLRQARLPPPAALGHRIVHGGPHLHRPALIDARLLNQLEAATAFAPLHLPASLAVLHQAARHHPGLPQVACFDTGFHAQLPDVARVLPLPRELLAEGIHRYGFHGLSCESVVRRFFEGGEGGEGGEVGQGGLPARLVIAHLGHGASVTAVLDGRSVDTSMGLTPSGGLPMGTRSGDLDPGVLLHLLRGGHFGVEQLAELIDRRSGLLGISGVSDDLRRLHDAAEASSGPGADARLAIAIFCAAVAKQVAGMATVLGGLDALVFTGGIGEHDAIVRARVGARLACLGVEIDTELNRRGGPRLHADTSRSAVWVMPAQEEERIARHTHDLVIAAGATGPGRHGAVGLSP